MPIVTLSVGHYGYSFLQQTHWSFLLSHPKGGATAYQVGGTPQNYEFRKPAVGVRRAVRVLPRELGELVGRAADLGLVLAQDVDCLFFGARDVRLCMVCGVMSK